MNMETKTINTFKKPWCTSDRVEANPSIDFLALVFRKIMIDNSYKNFHFIRINIYCSQSATLAFSIAYIVIFSARHAVLGIARTNAIEQ